MIQFWLNIIILFFLLVTAVAVIRARDLITSAILLAIFSLLMAAEYLVLGAADVAITEAAVGAGISTILILMAIFLVGNKEKRTKGNMFVTTIVVVFVALGLIYATFDMPSFGAADSPAQTGVSQRYLAEAQSQTGIPNVVTAVLASYRGYDTFGETIVVLTAAIAILLLLGRFNRKKENADE